MDRMEQLLTIDRQLVYRGTLRRVPLVSSGRHLVKHSELTELLRPPGYQQMRKSSLGTLAAVASPQLRRRIKPICLFLFTDLLLVCRRKL